MTGLTERQLRKALNYNPGTGRFTRLASNRSDLVGSVAGTTLNNGYIGIHIAGVLYSAHRLAFLYMTGHWPPAHVDHINGVRSDNHWANLRNASRSQNNQNSKRKGVRLLKGVELATDRRRLKQYSARICANGIRYSLGYFSTEEDAHAAYCAAAHRLHGDFARTA